MKKATFLLLYLLTLYSSSFAQKSHFTDNGNHWITYFYFNNGGAGGGFHSYYLDYYFVHDTVVNGYQYKTVNDNTYIVREDSISRKVYLKNISDVSDTAEHLLYNYNWVIGDSIKPITYHSTYWIDNIDSTLINGSWYKVWHFRTTVTAYSDFNIVEGIGCLNGYEYPVYGRSSSAWEQLRCFTSYGVNNALTPAIAKAEADLFDFSNTACATLATNNLNNEDHISIFPNPVNESSKISFHEIISGIFTITNSIGQTTFNTEFQNKKEIVFGDKIKIPGLYFYRVIDNQSKAIYSGKLIYR